MTLLRTRHLAVCVALGAMLSAGPVVSPAESAELGGGKVFGGGKKLVIGGGTTQRNKGATSRKDRKPFLWFFDSDNGRGDDRPNIVYGNDDFSAGRVSYDDDPEPLPTLGMGNIPYEPPLSVPVYDAAIAKLPVASGDAELIRIQLFGSRSAVRASVADRKSILELYKQRQFAPIWITNGVPDPRVEAVLSVLAAASEDGLNPLAYLPVGLSSFATAKSDLANLSPSDLMRFDISLTAVTLKYAAHLSSGQFEPARLSAYNDIKVETLKPDAVLRVLAHSPFPGEYLRNLAPKHPAYGLIKKELAALNNLGGPVKEPFPAGGKLVKVGQRDERVPELRTRMEEMSFLDPGETLVAENDLEVLDKALSKAIKAYQIANGIKATGQLDARLVAKLNEDPTEDQKAKLISSLERIRWLPKELGSRHVFVNQAAFKAHVVENGNTLWSTKVIVGKPLTQTSAFHDEFETVVFNPTWGIPQSILVNEYLPKLRRDAGYLDRIGYKVTTERGEPVSSRSINWWAFNNRVPYNVQQPAGDDNALGEIKFLFPNNHAIYMHDTPTRKLFSETVRSFSHGCVRVENPREFASILLGWDRDRVDAEVGSGDSFSTPVSVKTKVHLTYFAAWPDEAGKVQYYQDIYERDKSLIAAFNSTSKVLSASLQGRTANVIGVDGGIPQ